jgi:hypothetical protein
MAGGDDAMGVAHKALLYDGIRDGIRDAELAIVPGTSHFLLQEKPALRNAIVVDFLANAPVPTVSPIRRPTPPRVNLDVLGRSDQQDRQAAATAADRRACRDGVVVGVAGVLAGGSSSTTECSVTSVGDEMPRNIAECIDTAARFVGAESPVRVRR